MIYSSPVLCLLIVLFCTTSESAKGYGPGEQDWGHLDVREGAHMFYWLYYTIANVSSYIERPLVVWLVGGPGSSSAGYGNLDEVGPLTLEGKERTISWDKYTNLLFIDSPVGSGYSYVDDDSLFNTNNTEIALDFVSFMRAFYAKYPEFETVPLHLFGESYGGKMIADIALELYKAIKRDELRSNLKSVAMLSPRINPPEAALSRAPWLLNLGFIDTDGYDEIMMYAEAFDELYSAEKYNEGAPILDTINIITFNRTKGINSFNVLKKREMAELEVGEQVPEFNAESNALLGFLMNGEVAKALNMERNWGQDYFKVRGNLYNDLEKPIINTIVELLDTTDIEVGLVSGQLDAVAGPSGFVEFMEKLNWSSKADYEAAPREGISVDGFCEGYKKSGGRFTFFWINRAGHMIPQDNPEAMKYVLNYFTKFENYS